MKKTFGVLLILLAILLSLVLFVLVINTALNKGNEPAQENTAYSVGYIIGIFIVIMFFATLNFALYFFGFKLLKNKKKELISFPDKDLPSQLR